MMPSPHQTAAQMSKLWLDWSMLSFEAAQVIALRMMMISTGGPGAARESERMVSEKLRAMGDVSWKLALGQWGMQPHDQASGATRLYRGRVRANLRRLKKAK
ncbi:hypothetical protein [Novosphingobium terrae]|uniref:hypothetical protein n=1 Tax=Novosphingobium terrae TaxID=2726189 RepID=UPI00198211D5|nr:hypothetical protein [Novosphingobium terrae]